MKRRSRKVYKSKRKSRKVSKRKPRKISKRRKSRKVSKRKCKQKMLRSRPSSKNPSGGPKVAKVHLVDFPVSKKVDDMGDLGFFEGWVGDVNFFYRLSRVDEKPIGGIQIVPVGEITQELENAKAVKKRKILDGLKLRQPKHGDLVENVGGSGSRTEEVYVIKNTPAGLQIVDLDDSFGDHGHIGKDFSIGPEFPSGYWFNAPFVNASWHSEVEPVGVEIWSAITRDNLEREDRSDGVIFWKYEQPWGVLRFRADSADQVYDALKKYKTSALGAQEGLTLYMNEGEIVGL
tara:strand:+ start:29 stop:898 length:870 start_codon:yes stop_codon:yes gene_type:complete